MMSPNLELAVFGHYQVGDQIYDLKIPALLAASRTGIMPTWHYHQHVYEKQDWAGPITRSLNEIYQSRAKQLRAKYDYLVLSFSGGSDSWTALDAFRSSQTHLDEVFVRWPKKATQNLYQVNALDRHPSNILSEWDLAIQPALEMIRKEMPDTRISVIDWSDQILQKEITDYDWVQSIPQDYLNVGANLKWTLISGHERQQIDLGRKTCFLSGIDKPQIWIDHGKVYCYFLDKLANGFYNSHLAQQQGRTCEHFYWTPEMPEITVEQAKHIFLELKLSPRMADFIDRNKPFDSKKKSIWNAWTRPIIYPKYHALGVWQAQKSYSNVLDEVDNWMSVHVSSAYVQSWRWGLKNVLSSINDKFLSKKDDEIIGFTGFISGNYYLGDLNMLQVDH